MHFPDDKISPQLQQSDLHCEATGARRHCAWKIAGCKNRGGNAITTIIVVFQALAFLSAWKRNENHDYCDLRTLLHVFMHGPDRKPRPLSKVLQTLQDL